MPKICKVHTSIVNKRGIKEQNEIDQVLKRDGLLIHGWISKHLSLPQEVSKQLLFYPRCQN